MNTEQIKLNIRTPQPLHRVVITQEIKLRNAIQSRTSGCELAIWNRGIENVFLLFVTISLFRITFLKTFSEYPQLKYQNRGNDLQDMLSFLLFHKGDMTNFFLFL